MSVEEIHSRLMELADERGLSKYELSKRAGMKESTVYNMITRGTMPKIDTLDRLCKAMGLSLSDFFAYASEPRRQGYLSEQEIELLEVRRRLSERNAEHLLVYATGLAEGQETRSGNKK